MLQEPTRRSGGRAESAVSKDAADFLQQHAYADTDDARAEPSSRQDGNRRCDWINQLFGGRRHVRDSRRNENARAHTTRQEEALLPQSSTSGNKASAEIRGSSRRALDSSN